MSVRDGRPYPVADCDTCGVTYKYADLKFTGPDTLECRKCRRRRP